MNKNSKILLIILLASIFVFFTVFYFKKKDSFLGSKVTGDVQMQQSEDEPTGDLGKIFEDEFGKRELPSTKDSNSSGGCMINGTEVENGNGNTDSICIKEVTPLP